MGGGALGRLTFFRDLIERCYHEETGPPLRVLDSDPNFVSVAYFPP